VLLDVADAVAGDFINMGLRIVDQYGNVAPTTSSTVKVSLTGSAAVLATTNGIVSLQNGQGQVTITDIVAETVTVSLSQPSLTTLAVTSTKSVTFLPGALRCQFDLILRLCLCITLSHCSDNYYAIQLISMFLMSNRLFTSRGSFLLLLFFCLLA
jgi:hypothetical protein